MKSCGTILTSKKLKYINDDGNEIGEVDIWNNDHMLLCELGTNSKTPFRSHWCALRKGDFLA